MQTRFQKKRVFMKLTMFFISKTEPIYATTLTVLYSTFKMKGILPRILFGILLTSAVIRKQRFCTKTRLRNIFKTTNTKKLIKTILESPNKILQMPWKTINDHTTAHTVFHWPFNFELFFPFKLLELLHCFDKMNQTIFFKNSTLASQNRPKFTFLWQPSKK